MVTFDQCMDAIETVIKTRGGGISKQWLLVYHEGRFECLNGPNHPKEEVIIVRLSEYDCIEGLTSIGWENIRNKIRRLLSQGVIE